MLNSHIKDGNYSIKMLENYKEMSIKDYIKILNNCVYNKIN